MGSVGPDLFPELYLEFTLY